VSPGAKFLLELRERGFFTSADAKEICGRCWRRADRAIRELQAEGILKKADSKARPRSRWEFIIDNRSATC